VIRSRGVLLAAGLAGLGAAVPLLVSAPPLLDLAVLTAYYGLLAGSWNLLAGFTGQFSFAHLGLAAVGAYSSALLTHAYGVPVAATLPLAGLMAAVIGAVLGLVSLRVRGVQLPLITFAFSGVFGAWLTGAASITGGARGQPTVRMFSGVDYTPYVWLGLALVVLYYLAQWLILDGRLGLFARAVRENERVAEGLGVRSFVVKLVMFAYTAFWAGVSGSLYAAYVGIIAPSMLHLSEMAQVVAMVVVGGMGRPLAPLAGVVLLRVADHWVRSFGEQYTLLITAGITLLVVLISRDGLVGMLERVLGRSSLRTPWADDDEKTGSRDPRQPPPAP
jgi:branched-chain amino acid transport system permease protein